MNTASVIRIVDENLNRLSEGLRVLEDLARMILDDASLTQQLKSLRHDLVRGDLAFNLELLQSRNSAADVGIVLEVEGENKTKDLPLIAVANSRRAQESLRVLEELAKLPGLADRLDSDMFKKARFELYSLEQKLVGRLLRQNKARLVRGLYVIIDTGVLQDRNPLEIARQVIQAGVKVIQFRAKTADKKQILQTARQLQELCRSSGVLFVINDYLDIALAMGADGLHIGQEDLPVEVARRLLPPDRILGVSAATVSEVQAAEASGADYIGVGCIYPTSSKDDAALVGVDRVRQIRPVTRLPLVAIGGINAGNTPEVIEAGADSVCVISAVLNAPDPAQAARMINNLFEAKDEQTDN